MIFCDMDGVLTDFDGEFERRFGMPPHAIPRPELWEKVLAAKDYWYDLPKTAAPTSSSATSAVSASVS